MIKGYTYTSVLYREYRCKAVHEAAGIFVDSRRFWKFKRPYFVEWHSDYNGLFFKLEFPSSFLFTCLETSIECAEKAIRGKGVLPAAIWLSVCELDEFELLDTEGIEEARQIRLRID